MTPSRILTTAAIENAAHNYSNKQHELDLRWNTLLIFSWSKFSPDTTTFSNHPTKVHKCLIYLELKPLSGTIFKYYFPLPQHLNLQLII
jgi:hypothetical protein